jgi:hypothetical protein
MSPTNAQLPRIWSIEDNRWKEWMSNRIGRIAFLAEELCYDASF